MGDVRTALQLLVNYLESDPSLYDGDDDGAFGRVMQNAYDALADRENLSEERETYGGE